MGGLQYYKFRSLLGSVRVSCAASPSVLTGCFGVSLITEVLHNSGLAVTLLDLLGALPRPELFNSCNLIFKLILNVGSRKQ